MLSSSTSFRGLALAVMLAGIAIPGGANAQASSSVKAALVYNIIRFVSFPGNPPRVRICTLTGQSVNGDLRALNGRAVGGSRLEVVIVGSVREVGPNCDVVYLQSTPSSALNGIAPGQLVIGEGAGFAERGGTIGLVNFGGQVRFTINNRVAKSSGIQFSSQLMQLAAKVVS